MKGKNINLKHKPIIVLAGILLMAGIAVVLIVSLNKSGNKEEQSADVNVSKINLKPSQGQDDYTTAEETTVEILFENTAVPVGTSLKVTAIVSPDDNEKSLIWTSSNDAVFSVDKEGLVTVKGVGTATLTATVGSVSDAVVIEGISQISQGSDNGFVVYTGGDNHVTGSSSGNSSGQMQSGTVQGGSQNQLGGSTTDSGIDSGSAADGESIDSQPSGNVPENNQENSNSGSSQNNSSNSGSGSSSGDIGGMLSDRGFEQTASNVYVCREDGVYYGEIITQSNVTIIYIKQRNASFDSRIQSVVENLLPGNSSYVWNSYISASTDRTFTVDNRMVRIVVANGGGHSQIVIYN